MLKYLNWEPNVKEIYIFITFLGMEILFFIKQCPLKSIFGNEWWSRKIGVKI